MDELKKKYSKISVNKGGRSGCMCSDCTVKIVKIDKKSGIRSARHKLKIDLDELDKEKEESTSLICKVWPQCQHPELCKEKCFDIDLLEIK